MKLYSNSTGGFYSREIHGENIPADAVEITDDYHAELSNGESGGLLIVANESGYPILVQPPPPSVDQIKEFLISAVQEHIDSTAAAIGYDNIYTACTYADEPAVPKFQAEGQALRAWRSQVWARCHAVLADVEAGQRGIPTAEELIAELPALALP